LRCFIGRDFLLDPVAETPENCNKNQDGNDTRIKKESKKIEKAGESSRDQDEKENNKDTPTASWLFVSLIWHVVVLL